ncbi:MAG: Eco57I restriction-modification methylase domain-containing protein, partial [Cycloclasticus sp.]
GFDDEMLAQGVVLANYGLHLGDLTELKGLFEHATTFGSLIQVLEGLAEKLPALKQLSETTSQDLFVSEALEQLGPLVQQAELLAAQYDAVVANPPYMGGKFMNASLKKFVKDNFPNAKNDLFASFIERGYGLANGVGDIAMITMHSWMFLSSHQAFREQMLQNQTLRNLAHFPYDGKRPTVMEINFGVAVVVAHNVRLIGYQGHYCCSRYFELGEDGVPFEFPTPNERLSTVPASEFEKIPGMPVAYWASYAARSTFSGTLLGEIAKPLKGFDTGGQTEMYLRLWPEVSEQSVFREGRKLEDCSWVEANKGGVFRKWYGNRENLVFFRDSGAVLYNKKGANIRNRESYFRAGITYSIISSARISFRRAFSEAVIEQNGPTSVVDDEEKLFGLLALANSKVADHLIAIISPTMAYTVNDVAKLPIIWPNQKGELVVASKTISAHARSDWNAYERSWDFESLPILTASTEPKPTLESSYIAWITQNRDTIAEMKLLEEENNRLF